MDYVEGIVEVIVLLIRIALESLMSVECVPVENVWLEIVVDMLVRIISFVLENALDVIKVNVLLEENVEINAVSILIVIKHHFYVISVLVERARGSLNVLL